MPEKVLQQGPGTIVHSFGTGTRSISMSSVQELFKKRS